MALSVALAGGGTGGHVYPALALAHAIRRHSPEVQIRFVGTEAGLEARVVPAAGYTLECVPARPVLGRGPSDQLHALVAIARGVLAARRLLRRIAPDVVLGMGGYASVPAVLAALSLRIPVGLVEPNAHPGRSNRWLGRFVRGVFVQFDESLAWFPRGVGLRTGIPVRAVPAPQVAEPHPGTVSLLVFGGSQGAHSLNRAISGALDQLGERDGFRITHQTGPRDLDEVRGAYAKAGVRAEIAPFFDDLPQRLAAADLVIARAGASTVAELCNAGVGSVLVPYPYAADDHQMANARALERAGACRVVPDREVDTELAPTVRALAQDTSLLRRMGEQAERLAARDAADRIWQTCLGWIDRGVPGAAAGGAS
jgi:UDP-N-acetylglucosamine--N-acetylmuramyl-(pentapeptide) pyrophosphoryl-undecaprenol N-acetylglucosamine transferase